MSVIEACLIAYYLITAGGLLALWQAGVRRDGSSPLAGARDASRMALVARISQLRAIRRPRRTRAGA